MAELCGRKFIGLSLGDDRGIGGDSRGFFFVGI